MDFQHCITRIDEPKNPSYYRCLKWWMIELVSQGPNVIMDMGCATGVLGEKLLEAGKASEMYGTEILESAAAEAAKVYKHVHVGDAEEMALDYLEVFDYVICGDILEHLKDPYTVTKHISSWLKPGGKLLVCLPNLRNYRVIYDLVFRGRFEYVSAGILDRTHLRFFTKSSLRAMLEDGGFEVYHEQMVIGGPKKTLFNRMSLGLFEEFLGAQLFCAGQKSQASV